MVVVVVVVDVVVVGVVVVDEVDTVVSISIVVKLAQFHCFTLDFNVGSLNRRL